MRYYEYVSETKVQMLFDQIPPKLLSKLAAEARVDLKVVGVSVQKAQTEATLYSRLELVEDYLDRNYEITWMTEPGSWFRGELDLQIATYQEVEGQAGGPLFMVGQASRTLVALIGSSYHLIGSRRHEHLGGYSSLPALFRLLQREAPEEPMNVQGYAPDYQAREKTAALYDVGVFTRQLHGFGAVIPCEFLARRLLSGTTLDPTGNTVDVVVGTPLYVAQLDD
ncbi:hypothetical protein DEJ50_33720 [Streptomyces venezuelae]|uniref:Uncharacterized protein n=1 Tax=Streptomyces venezuelae TaxID=54571 RepID=A0A5P2DBY5_STRVZ|nr:SAVMC3_10250 family protein [Streptomyces venezuelae]QES52040.1 hypothetical protein DEJ50_33720 [Streptomyces venezuelae]